jgi:hypothetical protein
MQVSQAETSVPGFERHTLKCSACPQIARRLVSSHPKPPVANLPAVVTHPEPPASKLRTERAAAPRTWAKVSEKLRNRQTPTEKKSEAARSSAWADAVEKLRRRQAALKERGVDSKPLTAGRTVQGPAETRGRSASSRAPQEPAARQNAWERAVAKVRARHNGGSEEPNA